MFFDTQTVVKIYSVFSTLTAAGLLGGYFLPSGSPVACATPNNASYTAPILRQHPVIVHPMCGITRRVTPEVTVHTCGRGEGQFIARNNYGILLTLGEYMYGSV